MADRDDRLRGVSPSHVEDDLGLAGKMAKVFVHSPLSPLLFFAFLAMGVLGLMFTPRQEDPQISVPMIDIMLSYPGATSQDVAGLAIEPLERIMSEIPGVKHVYSVAMRGEGMVTVQFDVGEELGPSIVKVHDKIQSNMNKIPPGVQPPLVVPKGPDDVPVVTLTLWSDELDDGIMRTVAQDLLQSIKQIPNTGQGFIVGGRSEQVRIEVLPERISGYKLSLDQVASTIRAANSELQAGTMESGGTNFTVHTGSFLSSANDISRLVVSTLNGAPIYVRDIANVTQGPEETKEIVTYYTGRAYGDSKFAEAAQAVTVAVSKKVGANGVSVANDILDKVESLKGRLIPDNIHVEVTRNYGKTANDKVNSLLFKLFIATGAVVLLIWYALGVKPAVVVLLVIPVVLLMTVFAAWIFGFTIDRVSLFALIFSIGILVDDAIVVVENIYRRWLEKGEMDTETAIDAVREVGNPTILATFTVIAALLPMGAVSGMMGPYMAPIPALGSVAMLVSLVAAFVFTPWLAMRIRPSMEKLQAAEVKEHAANERLERFFRRILVPIINSRTIGYLTLGTIVVAFFASCFMFYTTAVAVKMLPLDNKGTYSVTIDMPEGTSLPTTANLTSRLAEVVLQQPEVYAVQTYVGTAQPFDFNGMVRHYYLRKKPWQAEIHVQLVDKGDRQRTSHDIAVAVRQEITPIARQHGARVTVVEMPPGPPVMQAVVAEVYGPDDQTRRQVARHLTDVFDSVEGLSDVDNYMQEPYKEWHFQVDAEKAVRNGISVDTINRNLAMAMGGFVLGDIKQGNVLEPTFIVIETPLSLRSDIARLGDLPIPTQQGNTIPLAELGKFVEKDTEQVIYHKDLRPVEFVVGEATGRLAAPIYAMSDVERALADYVTPDGVHLESYYLGPPDDNGVSGFEWTGEWTVTYETFRDMGAAFGVALILIYILVVWEFGNFVVPAVIMAPIPLTLIGIVPGHWLLNAEFTATSMIGFIALAGIIVRNSILLVDFSIHQIRAGSAVTDAVILACKTRTRPIVITALALVGGSSVILSDYIFQGMAISLLFGVLVSTLLTLVVIPLGCISARASLCGPSDDSDSDCVKSVVHSNPVSHSSGFAFSDLLVGLWRLMLMALQGVFFKLYQLLITAVFALIALFQSRKPPQPTPAPVVKRVTPEAEAPLSTAEALAAVTPAPEAPAVATVTAKESAAATTVTPERVAATAEVTASPSSPIVTAATTTQTDAVTTPATAAAVTPPPAVESVTTNPVIATPTVSVKRVVKKKVVKKVAISATPIRSQQEEEADAESGQGKRRGIRLKKSVDDFDI
ncbi:MAG: efflux RND transporter permease subunit [Gammaproteobacteria bacterium]|nr:efflux RND transporter permease subunit [Gammaproteobacteria bacterium]